VAEASADDIHGRAPCMQRDRLLLAEIIDATYRGVVLMVVPVGFAALLPGITDIVVASGSVPSTTPRDARPNTPAA